MPFFPVYATSAPPDLILSALDRRVSAILGGAHAVLAPGEPWPCCRECGGHLVPYIQVNAGSGYTPEAFARALGVQTQPGHVVLFQVFVCKSEGGGGGGGEEEEEEEGEEGGEEGGEGTPSCFEEYVVG